ncbi:hypothetical protein [uncultured Clostridium sp.]|uniref:hypothetical protein n=1 Tax=uncultured Clostridium sp. TaxID=59620 RepID=UPI0025D5E9B2|nr:hypothetical protein [uncultured Clostridium sp.]
MNKKKGILTGIIICELIIIPAVYFFIAKSLLATGAAAIITLFFVLAFFRKADKQSAVNAASFKEHHPEESILYCNVAEVCGNNGVGTLIITDRGLYFLIGNGTNIAEHPFLWTNIKSYCCSVTMDICTMEDEVFSFKVFDIDEIDKIVSQYAAKSENGVSELN